jgi:hypothetical protein
MQLYSIDSTEPIGEQIYANLLTNYNILAV